MLAVTEPAAKLTLVKPMKLSCSESELMLTPSNVTLAEPAVICVPPSTCEMTALVPTWEKSSLEPFFPATKLKMGSLSLGWTT